MEAAPSASRAGGRRRPVDAGPRDRRLEDYLALLERVSDPVTTPHNFTVGAVAYQLGLPEGAAAALQWVTVAAVAVLTVFAWFRLDPERSYLVTVVASQLVSPLLWDHYAMLLLLPVAWLLERRRWWAALVPLALGLPVVWISAIAYPISSGSCSSRPFSSAGPVVPPPADYLGRTGRRREQDGVPRAFGPESRMTRKSAVDATVDPGKWRPART